MREFSQTNGCDQPPAKRKRMLSLGGGFRLIWMGAAIWLGLSSAGVAQTLRLGPFVFSMTGHGEVGYDSNVDGLYPDEETPGVEKWDLYWMPGLSMQSQPVSMSHRITYSLSANAAYQDYFNRNDLDTEIYSVILNFQTQHPRLALGGMVGVDYSIDGVADQYVPGGASRDPVLTRNANVFANWNYRKVRLQTSADYSIELHQLEDYQEGDTEETGLAAGAFWDVFKWGSLFYSWDWTKTMMIQSGLMTEETDQSFGLSGALPLDLLRRPKITYSFGYSYEEEKTDTGEPTKTWEPTHTITAQDEYQLSKSIRLAASATWANTMQGNNSDVKFSWPWETAADENEVTFQYNVQLSQQLGPRMDHALSFTREPRPTFGSSSDTETTTYGYTFGIRDLLVYGLSFSFSALYDTSIPLGVEDAEMEKTTTINAGLSHSRQLSRKLSRVLAYQYTWENTNFHDGAAKEQHLVTYGLTYAF